MAKQTVKSLGHECKYIEWISRTDEKMDNLVEGVGAIKDKCGSHHEESHKQSENIIKIEGRIKQALKETQLLFDKDKARVLKEEKDARYLKLKEEEDLRMAQLSNGARGRIKKHAPVVLGAGGIYGVLEVVKYIVSLIT